MKCYWAILCEKTLTDQESNQLSLIEILEKIEIPKFEEKDFPVFYQSGFDLVTYWKESENDEHEDIEEFRIVIDSPVGETLLENEYPLRYEGGETRIVSKFHFPGLPISGEGTYLFKIEIPTKTGDEWEEVSRIALEVNYIDEDDDE